MNNDELMTGKDSDLEELTGENTADIVGEGRPSPEVSEAGAVSESEKDTEKDTGEEKSEAESFSVEDSEEEFTEEDFGEEEFTEDSFSAESLGKTSDDKAPDPELTPPFTGDKETADEAKKTSGSEKHRKKKKRKHRSLNLKPRIPGKKLRIVLIAALVIAVIILVRVIAGMHVSSKYSVLNTSEREGSVDSSYETFCGEILRYSSDGAALTGTDGTAIWNETFDMDTPILDIDDSIATVYDQKGTDIYVFDSKGVVGKVTTDKPILKARVSSQGMIAAILEDGDTTWINFYSTSGDTIATAKTRIDSPGYPVDLDVSENGKLLAVSYLYVDGETPTSYVAFYNFSAAGQSQMDNVVSAYTYTDVMVPQVSFLSGSTAVAIRDNGIMLYTGSEIPAESFTVDEEDEILSCFTGDSFIGLVTANQDEKSTDPYVMSLYDLKGKRIAQREFSGDYTTIRVDDDMIFLYNDRQLCIFNNKGHETFQGVITEGSIQDVCRVSTDRFLIVMSDKIETIKIK